MTIRVPSRPASAFRPKLSRRKANPSTWWIAVKTTTTRLGALNEVRCLVTPQIHRTQYLARRPSFSRVEVAVRESGGEGLWAHMAQPASKTGQGIRFECIYRNGRDVPVRISSSPELGGGYPDGIHTAVVSRSTGTVYRSGQDLSFTLPANGEKHVLVVAGSPAFIDAQLDRVQSSRLHLSCSSIAHRGRPVELRYSVPYAAVSHADLRVYDLRGRLIWSRALTGEALKPGDHHLTWNLRTSSGSAVSAGKYAVRIRTPGAGGYGAGREVSLLVVE
jgi:hypothetical protein